MSVESASRRKPGDSGVCMPAKRPSKNHPTILIIDDASDICLLLEMMLDMAGYRVLQASNGLDGYLVFKENCNAIDLVISDVEMPRMDGPKAVQKIREIKSDQKVIFMTGNVNDRFRKLGRRPDVAATITKPFDMQDVLKKVKALV